MDTIKVIEVNALELFGDYTTPDDVPEWTWIEENARFTHVGNDTEPGVWEFLVHVTCHPNSVAIPALLQPFFTIAKENGSTWVLFHQG